MFPSPVVICLQQPTSWLSCPRIPLEKQCYRLSNTGILTRCAQKTRSLAGATCGQCVCVRRHDLAGTTFATFPFAPTPLSFFLHSLPLSFFLKPRLFPRRHHHHNLRSLSSATNYFRRSGRSAVNSAYLMQIVSTRELTAETIASPPPHHHHQNVVQDLLLFSAVLPLTGTSPPRR